MANIMGIFDSEILAYLEFGLLGFITIGTLGFLGANPSDGNLWIELLAVGVALLWVVYWWPWEAPNEE